MENWRRYINEQRINEDLAHIRFPHLKKISQKPESNIQNISSDRQMKIFLRKFYNAVIYYYEKQEGRELTDKEKKNIWNNYENSFNMQSFSGAVKYKTKLPKVFMGMAHVPKDDRNALRVIADKLLDKIPSKKIPRSSQARLDKQKDLRDTRKHEAIHLMFKEIKSEYGFIIYSKILNGMKTVYKKNSPEAYQEIKNFLNSSFDAYAKMKDTSFSFFEEILTWTREILSGRKAKNYFKKYLSKKYNTSNEEEIEKMYREVTTEMKKAWKKLVKYAQDTGK